MKTCPKCQRSYVLDSHLETCAMDTSRRLISLQTMREASQLWESRRVDATQVAIALQLADCVGRLLTALDYDEQQVIPAFEHSARKDERTKLKAIVERMLAKFGGDYPERFAELCTALDIKDED